MLRHLPPVVRGTLAAALLGLNTLFWCTLVFALALVNLAVPAKPVRRVVDRALDECATR